MPLVNDYEKWTLTTDNSSGELFYYALGLAGETGETVDVIKKRYRHAETPMTEEETMRAAEELGDVLWYMVRLAAKLGFTLDEIATMNREKLTLRYGGNNGKGK